MKTAHEDLDSLREQNEFLKSEMVRMLEDLTDLGNEVLRERRRADGAEAKLARARRIIRRRWGSPRVPWWRRWFGG